MSLAISATLSIASTAVIADNTGKIYLGIQLNKGAFFVGGDKEYTPKGALVRFGGYINDSFALEGRMGTGIGRFVIDSSDSSEQSFSLDELFGIYGVRHLNINETSSIYSIIGVSKVRTEYGEADVNGLGEKYYNRNTGFSPNAGIGLSLGVGAKIGITNNVALNFEYMQYLNQSSFVYNTLGFGLKFKVL